MPNKRARPQGKKKLRKGRKRGNLIKGILENIPAESFDILYSEREAVGHLQQQQGK